MPAGNALIRLNDGPEKGKMSQETFRGPISIFGGWFTPGPEGPGSSATNGRERRVRCPEPSVEEVAVLEGLEAVRCWPLDLGGYAGGARPRGTRLAIGLAQGGFTWVGRWPWLLTSVDT